MHSWNLWLAEASELKQCYFFTPISHEGGRITLGNQRKISKESTSLYAQLKSMAGRGQWTQAMLFLHTNKPWRWEDHFRKPKEDFKRKHFYVKDIHARQKSSTVFLWRTTSIQQMLENSSIYTTKPWVYNIVPPGIYCTEIIMTPIAVVNSPRVWPRGHCYPGCYHSRRCCCHCTVP